MTEVEGWQLGTVRNATHTLKVRDAKDGRRVVTMSNTAGAEVVCKIAFGRQAEAELRSKLRDLPTPSPSGQPCPKGDLPGWRQIFVDDFDTPVPLGSFPAAVSAKWNAYPYPWQDTSKNGLYHPEKVVSIHDGMMDLYLHTETVDGRARPLVSVPYPNIGPKLYGRYAVRFKADRLPGYKTAWLLWPASDVWPRDGEIDFPEGDLDATICGFMHRQNGVDGGDQEWALSGKSYADWHTAVIEWSPGRCAFYLDGQLITNASGGKSEWTARVPSTPMQWVLQTETALEGGPANATQGHVLIDWVSVWVPA